MNLRRKAERFLRRVFHRKKRRSFSQKDFRSLLEAHLKMHEQIMETERAEAMTIDGQSYDAAVEKFKETMIGPHQILPAPENSSWTTKAEVHDMVSVIRVSKLAEFLLSLGIRIKG